jgi:hypothetical protein
MVFAVSMSGPGYEQRGERKGIFLRENAELSLIIRRRVFALFESGRVRSLWRPTMPRLRNPRRYPSPHFSHE